MDANDTETPDGAMSPEITADTQAVIDHMMTGRPLDPEVARRVHERARAVTEAIRRRHGVLDIGVPAIRELRDGE
jgi:hypothetical protein